MIWSDEFQRDPLTHKNDLTAMFEIHCNLVAYNGLNLPDPPIGLRLHPHQGANFETIDHSWDLERHLLKGQ